MFSKHYRKTSSPLQSDEIRARLCDAILSENPERFREILIDFSPTIASQNRWYMVITLESEDPVRVRSIIVDQTGERVRDLNVPMPLVETLNADIVGDHMIATIGDRKIQAYIGPMRDLEMPPIPDDDE